MRKLPRVIDIFKKIPGVKTEKRANIVAVITSLICISLSIVILRGGKVNAKITYIEDIPADVRPHIPQEILKNFPSRNAQSSVNR
jgi:hypothetical protein